MKGEPGPNGQCGKEGFMGPSPVQCDVGPLGLVGDKGFTGGVGFTGE